jgi:hypothetical protein
MEIDASLGLTRVTWDLRGDTPEPEEEAEGRPGGAFGRRARRGPLVEPGRFEAVLGWKVGDDVVEVGEARSFHVIEVQW